ncbi:efflux RND transporter periplasmic adaptor subunit [Alteromonas sp. SM 2104]|nr:efflux RND transporter periplasmic adaptor subunit [Alteromonas oceanisediminis]
MQNSSFTHYAAFIISVLVFTSSTASAQWSGDSAAAVLVEPVTFETIETKVEAVGTAEALKSVVLFPAVADRVIAVNFAPGQSVKQGDVLLALDARRQKVALARAEIELADTQRTYQRLKDSLNEGAVAQSALDDAKTLRDLAQVALNEAKADLEDRFLIAPFDGVVGLTDVEVGDRITVQTAVTTIDQRDKMLVNFRAPESALQVLLNKPAVTLQPWSNRAKTISASIAEVDSRINDADRTLRARALLDNQHDNYRPGMSFRVSLTLLGERYAAIPEAALLWGAAGAYVWKSVDGKATKVPVEVKQRLRGRILVDGDLAEGETLIAEGVQRLRSGQAVTFDGAQLAIKQTTSGAQG